MTCWDLATNRAGEDHMWSRQALRGSAVELLQARQEERRRIARGLHDETGQLLAAARLRLHALRIDASQEQSLVIDEVDRLVGDAIDSTRSLTFDLIAPADDAGFEDSLARLARHVEEHYGVPCRLSAVSVTPTVSNEVASALVCVTSELLFNVAKHAGATKVGIEITTTPDTLQIAVVDDGIGFRPVDPLENERSGIGLLIAHERMAEIGADVQIESLPGVGTRVILGVPLAACGG